jgi:hypothetical protein
MAKRTINDKYEKSYVDLDNGLFVELQKEDIKTYKLSDILSPFNQEDDPDKQRYFEMTIKEVQPDYEPGQG